MGESQLGMGDSDHLPAFGAGAARDSIEVINTSDLVNANGSRNIFGVELNDENKNTEEEGSDSLRERNQIEKMLGYQK